MKAEIHNGEIVVSIPSNVRFFGIQLMVETASSDRDVQPAGHFMCPLQFEVDAGLLRKSGFYKEPFVLKLSSSITLEQEAQSV